MALIDALQYNNVMSNRRLRFVVMRTPDLITAHRPSKTANARFTVSNLSHATFVYESTNNHDPESDSNGGAITVIRR